MQNPLPQRGAVWTTYFSLLNLSLQLPPQNAAILQVAAAMQPFARLGVLGVSVANFFSEVLISASLLIVVIMFTSIIINDFIILSHFYLNFNGFKYFSIYIILFLILFFYKVIDIFSKVYIM